MKVRIAVVTPLFPIRDEPYRGLPIYRTVSALQRLAEVEVFCPMIAYPRWALADRVNYRYHRADPTYAPGGVKTAYIEYPALPVLTRPLNGLVSGRHALPHIRRFGPDVILNYWLYPEGYGAVRAGRELGVPVVVGSRGSDLRRIRDPFTRWLTGRTLQQASFVLAVSEDLRRRAIALGAPAERVRTVMNGCDGRLFQFRPRAAARAELDVPEADRVVLFAGWLSPTKGLLELIEAIARLAPRHPRLELCCIGEGNSKAGLEKSAAERGIAGRVHFLGPRPSADVARWMAAADVFCLPSHSEGLPNVVIEALCCGRPVVATEVGGIPDLVDGTCGILVPPGAPEALAEALDQALSRPWDEHAIARRFNRSWDQVAEETYEVCLRARADW